MHIHLPKPLHGWREFLGEVGIIVVGVLIALAAEEALTELNWHRKAERGEAALKREALESSQHYVEQLTVGPCIIAQIDELRSKVLTSSGLKGIEVYDSKIGRQVIRTPSRDYASDVWTSLLTDGTAAHMEDSRQHLTAQYYALLDELRRNLPETVTLQQKLLVLADPIALDPQAKYEIFQTLAQLRSRTALQTLQATQSLAKLRDLGRLPPPETLEEEVNASKKSGTVAVCTRRKLPLGNWRKDLAGEPVQVALSY